MYDNFACEYGYTLQDFLKLTLRQVVALHHKIYERRIKDLYTEVSVQAMFKRVKLPPLSHFLKGSETATPLDKEVDLKLEKAAFDRLKQKQEAYERGRQRTTDKT